MINRKLKYNLNTKKELKFDQHKKFKILVLSDIQESLNYNIKTLDDINKLIYKIKPDFIMLNGDIFDGSIIKDKEELKKYLDIFTEPMEKRKIPWAHVFGNHEHDLKIDDDIEQEIYESYDYCLSKHTDSTVKGTTNFVLPIKDSKGKKIIFNLFALDCNNRIDDSFPNMREKTNLPNVSSLSAEWDFIHFSQIKWYYETSENLEKYNNKKVPAILFTHISLWETDNIKKNPKETNLIGESGERLRIGALNSGLFTSILERGDVKAIISSHSHEDTFSGTFCNIKFQMTGSAGYSAYGKEELKGGVLIELAENNLSDIKTKMIYYKDL